MLQQYGLVKRIERINRLRFLYALHLTLYGVLMVWLPLLLTHTTAQTIVELRDRCTTNQPIPLQAINRYTLPVILYDEQGNPIGGEDQRNYLPR